MNKFSALFGGAGLGALIGILIGLSTSSMVGMVVGALTSVLLVLLGFKENSDLATQALRVGAFGFTCTIAVLAGLHLRANNSFSPTIETEIAHWTADNIFTDEEAKRYFLYDKFGFVPDGSNIDTVRQQLSKRSLTQLFSTEVSLEECDEANGFEDFPIANELEAYQTLDGVWKKLAVSIAAEVEQAEQKKMLHLMRNCLCDE